jgi:DNA-binding LacI/PurR family transcriptional regulator
MVTMKDVARKAGVSLGTVSNVLNNVSTVSEENRRKVLDAVKELNYRVNTVARTLKTKTSRSIGLIIPDITNPYYPELARGVEDAAKKAGLSCFLCNNDRNRQKEKEYINLLIQKNADGMILVKPQLNSEELSELCEKYNVILVDSDSTSKPWYNTVNVDDYEGVMKALNLLYEFNHTRIAFIGGLLDSQSSKFRYMAYKDFFAQKGLELREEYMKRGNYDWYGGYYAAVELLRLVNPPTAIFAANDLMAIGAMKAIRERLMNIPFDISVMGYDDILMASLCSPQLTTIRQPKYEIGTVSVEILVEILNNKDHDKKNYGKQVKLSTEIIMRESVGYAKE